MIQQPPAPRILLVEDDDPMRLLIRHLVRQVAPQSVIREAYDGQTGLEAACAQPPCLLIVDQTMPRLSGLDLVLRLRAEEHTYPIVLTSVHAIQEQALIVGATQFLHKPFPAAAFRRTLRELLSA